MSLIAAGPTATGSHTGLLALDAHLSRLRQPRLSEAPVGTILHRRRFLAAAGEAVAGVALTGWTSAVRASSGQPATGAGERPAGQRLLERLPLAGPTSWPRTSTAFYKSQTVLIEYPWGQGGRIIENCAIMLLTNRVGVVHRVQ
jgi:hypothetical protein